MKRIIWIFFIGFIASTVVYADNRIDIDFTRDSLYWTGKFPALSWNAQETDYFVGQINNYNIDGVVFKGAFGKFNANAYQPFNSEDFCEQFFYAFRIANTGNSYIELPQIEDAGQLTIHCKSGNANNTAEFSIEKLNGATWEKIADMVAPPHGNVDQDVVLRKSIKSSTPVKLRLYGATRNLHVYAISVSKYGTSDSEDEEEKEKENIRFVVMPDTQNYSDEYPHIFYSQTSWIANNADSISFVMHVGDITNHNSPNQWLVAADAMKVMDGKVAYTFCPGNRDMGENGTANERNTTLFNMYFPHAMYSENKHFGGVFENNRMDNSWHTFESKLGYSFLLISLEFAPRNEVLEWAKTIIEQHPKHNVVINTHAYLYSDNQRLSSMHGHHWTPDTFGFSGLESYNDGEDIWNKLVKLYPNIFMVVSGHVMNGGTGMLVSDGDYGNKVYQMLANYQNGVDGAELGGSGYLRIIDFDPELSEIAVSTYSPFLNENLENSMQAFSFQNVSLIKNDISHVQNEKTSFDIKITVVGKNLHISTQQENLNLKVFSLIGQELYHGSVKRNTTLSALPSGSYLLHISDGNKEMTRKVILK